MRILLYKAGDAQSHKELGRKLIELTEGEYVITIKKNRVIRSLNANKYYHFILNVIAVHTGHTHEELHEALKMKFNSEMIFFPKSGSQIVARSTSHLDTAQFAAYINRVKNWALNEFSIILPEAKDVDYQKWIDAENQYDLTQTG